MKTIVHDLPADGGYLPADGNAYWTQHGAEGAPCDCAAGGGGGPVNPVMLACDELHKLMAANALQPGQWYGITSGVNPQVHANQVLYVQAVSDSMLDSGNALLHVPAYNYPGDDYYWPARAVILTGLGGCFITYLRDPWLRNEAVGYGAVNGFPWGNGNVRDNYVSGSLHVDPGATAIENVVHTGGALYVYGNSSAINCTITGSGGAVNLYDNAKVRTLAVSGGASVIVERDASILLNRVAGGFVRVRGVIITNVDVSQSNVFFNSTDRIVRIDNITASERAQITMLGTLVADGAVAMENVIVRGGSLYAARMGRIGRVQVINSTLNLTESSGSIAQSTINRLDLIHSTVYIRRLNDNGRPMVNINDASLAHGSVVSLTNGSLQADGWRSDNSAWFIATSGSYVSMVNVDAKDSQASVDGVNVGDNISLRNVHMRRAVANIINANRIIMNDVDISGSFSIRSPSRDVRVQRCVLNGGAVYITANDRCLMSAVSGNYDLIQLGPAGRFVNLQESAIDGDVFYIGGSGDVNISYYDMRPGTTFYGVAVSSGAYWLYSAHFEGRARYTIRFATAGAYHSLYARATPTGTPVGPMIFSTISAPFYGVGAQNF